MGENFKYSDNTTLGLSDGGSCEVSGSDSDRVVKNPAPLQQFALCHHNEKSPQALGLKQKYYVYRVKSFWKLCWALLLTSTCSYEVDYPECVALGWGIKLKSLVMCAWPREIQPGKVKWIETHFYYCM